VGGERDPLIPRLRALVDDLDLADVVRFVDNDHRIDDWMEAADVLCHPARLDAFPLVCILSAACATPVVAFSGVGGITEMMGSSFVGSEFPDVAGMVDRLVEVLSGDPTAVGAQQADAVSRFLSTTAAPQAVETILRLALASTPSNEVDA
jgi:glycosyltransferase involved in cell wall biosynthesis